MHNNPQTLYEQLRTDLLMARKARNQITSATLESLISAIDNAGAVPVAKSINTIGVGSTEALRRNLSEQDMKKIVNEEITEIENTIKILGNVKSPYYDELIQKVTVLKKYL